MENETINRVGEISLVYRKISEEKITIKNSQNVADFARSIWPGDIQIIERFLLLVLNRANEVFSWHWISQGGISGTVVDTRLIFKSCIDSLGSSFICVHNHPSGNIQPSNADEILTEKIKNSGKILELELLDHVIISPGKYYSFADENNTITK
jgi:DNA repair protein RadC